jgi:hypothetical protein
MAYELNAKIYTSRQFSVISPMFPSRSSFKPVHKLILKFRENEAIHENEAIGSKVDIKVY